MPATGIPSRESPNHELLIRRSGQRFREQGIRFLLQMCALLSVFTTVGIVFILFNESVFSFGSLFASAGGEQNRAFFQQVSPVEFFGSFDWSPRNDKYGVLPLLTGTLMITMISAVVGLPVGVLAAVYLSEYATPRTREVVKPSLELLAGIPTIVFGFFALRFITPYVLRPFFGLFGIEVSFQNALSAGIVVGLMIIPMVCSLSEDAMRSVPRTLREAGYALGATKFDVSVKVVIPAAFSGIIASFLLALARSIGETMAVTLAAGTNPELNLNPLQGVYTMTAYMVSTQSGEADAYGLQNKSLYAVGLCLFLLTLFMSVVSQWVMKRFREAYQ